MTLIKKICLLSVMTCTLKIKKILSCMAVDKTLIRFENFLNNFNFGFLIR